MSGGESPSRLSLLVGLLLAGPLPLAGQVAREWGVQATVTTGEPVTAVVGPTWGWRVGRRDRVVLDAGIGVAERGQLAGRGEALWHFLLSPGAQGKPALYAGGGLAAAVTDRTRGWVVVTAGVDWSPGSRSGWMAELGVGGGVRVAVGYRWRK